MDFLKLDNFIMQIIFILVLLLITLISYISTKIGINKYIGYRTEESMKNVKNWKILNRKWLNLNCKISVINIFLILIILFLKYINYINKYLYDILTILILFLTIILSIALTYLNEK